MTTKELIIRVTKYKDCEFFCDLVGLIGGKVVDTKYNLPDNYYDILVELTPNQSITVLKSLNGRGGKLLAPNKTQA